MRRIQLFPPNRSMLTGDFIVTGRWTIPESIVTRPQGPVEVGVHKRNNPVAHVSAAGNFAKFTSAVVPWAIGGRLVARAGQDKRTEPKYSAALFLMAGKTRPAAQMFTSG